MIHTCTKWHWHGFVSDCIGFPLPILFLHCSILFHPKLFTVYSNLEICSVVITFKHNRALFTNNGQINIESLLPSLREQIFGIKIRILYKKCHLTVHSHIVGYTQTERGKSASCQASKWVNLLFFCLHFIPT